MKIEKAKDLITSVLFVIFGITAGFWLVPYGIVVPSSVKLAALSPDFWPRIVVWGIILSSGFLLLETLFLKAPQGDNEDSEQDAQYKLDTLPATLRLIILILALFIFYYVLIHLGMVASSIVLMPTMMLYFGERNWKYILPLSILIPVGLYLFFLHVAGIPMPLGMFENFM